MKSARGVHCPQCDKVYQYTSGLSRHYKAHQGGADRRKIIVDKLDSIDVRLTKIEALLAEISHRRQSSDPEEELARDGTNKESC